MSIKKQRIVDDFDKSAQVYYKELVNFKPLNKKEENTLWKQYKYNNDISARNKILESNLKFVALIAKHYKGRGLSYSELVAEGKIVSNGANRNRTYSLKKRPFSSWKN